MLGQRCGDLLHLQMPLRLSDQMPQVQVLEFVRSFFNSEMLFNIPCGIELPSIQFIVHTTIIALIQAFPHNQLGELLVIQIHPTLSIKIRIDAFGL
jgi:hypothetical protein